MKKLLILSLLSVSFFSNSAQVKSMDELKRMELDNYKELSRSMLVLCDAYSDQIKPKCINSLSDSIELLYEIGFSVGRIEEIQKNQRKK